jgi:putative transposase
LGVQYVAVRYTQRLAEAGAVASVGSTGDSYNNALAEAFNSLCSRPNWSAIGGSGRASTTWRSPSPMGAPPTQWGNIDWFNHRRLHGEIGLIPPAEYEDTHYRHNTAATTVATSVPSLH